MSVAEIKNKERVIKELMGFIRKVLVDPEISPKALEIARKYIGEDHADVKIADELSATTSVKIPAEHSDADRLFLQVLKEVVKDEKALY
ncbi:hypothetical protein [Marinobacterium arenosum]|uniref:hypothetical protein n=1 Tax=Marinobacterium arenosum TaxID=2862496 RepID=UPI001C96D4FC|nr:hypothetical protein [Marinobacterium arenosum]MBY4675626.1 hypothetical protein [Marinobacterium arenosum]